ncbi:MAG: hypothetical protein V4484_06925 [Pseudomonadota bacterium]
MKTPAAVRLARRACLLAGAALFAMSAHAQLPPRQQAHAWVATWGTAPAGPPPLTAMQTFNNQT